MTNITNRTLFSYVRIAKIALGKYEGPNSKNQIPICEEKIARIFDDF